MSHSHEDTEHSIMHMRVSLGVEYRQQNQSGRSNDRRDDRANAQESLSLAVVRRQPVLVPKPSLGDECQIKPHDHHCASSNE